MKCYKSVQNVESNGNIEMMYSSAELKAQARESEQEEGRNQPNTPGDGPEWGGLFVFISFSPLISKLMVDILMGGNTQMYYLNGRIDYNEIVTQPGRTQPLLSPGPWGENHSGRGWRLYSVWSIAAADVVVWLVIMSWFISVGGVVAITKCWG